MRVAFALLLLSAPAHAGSVDTEVAADFFRASSVFADETLASHEIGMRIRVDLRELEDRLEVHADYHGREPFGGDPMNAGHRLLYRAELSYALVEDRFTLGLGRFIPAAVMFTPVDGLRAELKLGDFALRAFGGRRAITTSRRNVALDRFLPAAGLGLAYRSERYQAALGAGFSRDDLVLFEATREEPFDALSLYLDASARPIDALFLGGAISFLGRAGFTLGPVWSTVDVDVSALDLFNGHVWAEWRPLPSLRARYTFHHQSVAAFRARVSFGGATITDEAPRFLDNRIDLGWRFFDLGWLRPELRHRIRNDRTELRGGGRLEVDTLGVPGLVLRGRLLYEDVRFDAEGPDLDRLLWSAAVGYKKYGVDAELGARLLERAAAPVSGRADVPREIEDLAPFVLDAQRVVFLRGFYSADEWFLGLDAEKSLEESELRFFVQAGVLWGAEW